MEARKAMAMDMSIDIANTVQNGTGEENKIFGYIYFNQHTGSCKRKDIISKITSTTTFRFRLKNDKSLLLTLLRKLSNIFICWLNFTIWLNNM